MFRVVSLAVCAAMLTACQPRFDPEDPVKYDFALTRLGIRDDTDMDSFLASCGSPEVA